MISDKVCTQGSELIDVDRVVPEKETIKRATEFDFEIYKKLEV